MPVNQVCPERGHTPYWGICLQFLLLPGGTRRRPQPLPRLLLLHALELNLSRRGLPRQDGDSGWHQWWCSQIRGWNQNSVKLKWWLNRKVWHFRSFEFTFFCTHIVILYLHNIVKRTGSDILKNGNKNFWLAELRSASPWNTNVNN